MALLKTYKKTRRETPKTGLTGAMRHWMKCREGSAGERRFYVRELCRGIGILPGDERQKVRMALYDFAARGEVTFRVNRKRNRRHYLYNRNWKPAQKGKINRRMFKAMYVSSGFTVTDVQRLTGIEERNWIDKTVRKLIRKGHLQQVGRRLCAHGSGAEKIYCVVERDNFKVNFLHENSTQPGGCREKSR